METYKCPVCGNTDIHSISKRKELKGIRINKEDKPLIESIKRKNDSPDQQWVSPANHYIYSKPK